MASFPTVRMRRTRQNEQMRSLVRETRLSVEQLIYPLFIAEGITEPREIGSMPGIMQWPVEGIAGEVKRVAALGIPAILLFGIPAMKDEVGSQAYATQGIIQQAIQRIKAEVRAMLVITDVCLCEYTSHGHCGVIRNGDVHNDESLGLLARMALSHVEAGADIVAREAAYTTNGAAGLFDIEPLKAAIMRIRAALRSKPRREGNMAVAELHVDGLPPQVAAHSGIGAPTAAQQALGLVGAAGNDFKTFPVANRQGDLISRARDSEANILGYAAQQLGDNTAATGTINIFTELVMCASCRGVVDQFMEKYPGIQVNVLDNADIRLIPPKQVP